MSLKVSVVFICLSGFSMLEAKIIMTATELDNNIETNLRQSKGSERINLSMPGI